MASIRHIEGMKKGTAYFVPANGLELYPGLNKRQVFDLDELKTSIKERFEQGMSDPIIKPLETVSTDEHNAAVIDGNRRLFAVRELITEGVLPEDFSVPCIHKKLKKGEEDDLIVRAILHNEGKPFEPLEEAMMYKQLLDRDYTIAAVSKMVGKSRPTLYNILRLLELPEEAQSALMEGKIGKLQASKLVQSAKQECGEDEAAQQQYMKEALPQLMEEREENAASRTEKRKETLATGGKEEAGKEEPEEIKEQEKEKGKEKPEPITPTAKAQQSKQETQQYDPSTSKKAPKNPLFFGATKTEDIALRIADIADDIEACGEDTLCVAHNKGILEGLFYAVGGEDVWGPLEELVTLCQTYRFHLEAHERAMVELENAKKEAQAKTKEKNKEKKAA